MGIVGRIKRHKYFRYDLFVNAGDKWKQFGDGFKEYLDYKDIENPDLGSILRFYGVYKDKTQKDGWARKLLWEKEVPIPGGGKTATGKGGEKEKPIEERLMEKIIEGADFSNLKPNKMSVPLGKSGGSLEFESPVTVPGGDGSGGGYVVIDGNRYPMGDMSPLEFDGKLPAWLHPAAGAMITSLMDRAFSFFKGSVADGISQATGIKVKGSGDKSADGKKIEEPPDALTQLDNLLEEDEKKEEKKIEKKEEKKEEVK